MKLDRRKFIKLSSITVAGVPLRKITGNADWYDYNPVSTDELYHAFQNPVNTSKPFVRWWWNGNRIVKDELLRELEMLKNIGVGGVEINSIRFPETADPLNYKELPWLSDEWMEMLDFTLKEAKKRGMTCDIIMGSGWPFGGEFLTKDEQTQIMALGTRDVVGPQVLKVSREELQTAVDPPISSKNPKKYKELSALRLAPANLKSLDQTINFDAEVGKDEITINVPEGNHVLYFLVKLTGFMAVMFGAPGAAGPVLNHYNKKAVEGYLNKMSDAITPKLGSMGKHFRSVFTDSLELEGANWCDDMFDEFEKRRHYSLKPYLPFILFKTGALGRAINEKYGSVPSAELQDTLDRVRYDFEITKQELFQERFFTPFLNWCKKNGVKSRVQAYGREYHPSDSSMQVDIPECETWMRAYIGEDLKDFDYAQGRAYAPVNKFVSSGARLAGKKLISCEEITNTSVVFNATLEMIKLTGDQSNLSGVTHSILHGFNYSPADAHFPGWIRYGTFFNERNPWWPYLKHWTDYKARLSTVFQNGTLVSDIAVMYALPDLWSKYAVQWDPFPEKALPDYAHNVWEAIHQNGNGCDYVSENVLQHATYPEGKLTYGPRQYKMLFVVGAETIHVDTAKALKRYADAGGKIIFIEKYPHKAPGYFNHEGLDRQVSDIMDSIRAKVAMCPAPSRDGRIIDWWKDVQQKFNIKPYFKTDNPQTLVSQVHYKFDGGDAFFISNYSIHNRFEMNAEFDVPASKTAWLWDTETGHRYLYPTEGKNNKLKLVFGPCESKMIVFDSKKQGEKYKPLDFSKKPMLAITKPWVLTLNHLNGTKKTLQLSSLVDFKDDAELVSFGGAAVYENTFQLEDIAHATYLNLGKVKGVSEVTLNGKVLGTRWYGDHVYPLKGAVLKGDNKLSVKLTTTMGNYMASLKDNKDTIKWIQGKKQPLYSMGVMGPVEIG